MIDAGADLVVGHHPHVVQPVEKYRERWIAYSLGNFIFDQKLPQLTHHGVMLKIALRGKQIAEVSTIPITIDRTFQAYVTPPKELASRSRRVPPRSSARLASSSAVR